MEWLVERKKSIAENISDSFFKKIMLQIHDEYAEQYIILRDECAKEH